MAAEEITGEMIEAGRKAAAHWQETGQSGAAHRAIYVAMRSAAGVSEKKLQAEMHNFTIEILHAGQKAEAEWHSHQSGPREMAIYLAMRAAA